MKNYPFHRLLPRPFILLLLLWPLIAASQPSINALAINFSLNDIEADSVSVGMYQKLEFDLDITAAYDNPFDYSQLSLEAKFIAPDGSSSQVDAFYYQDFSRENGRPQPRGPATWRLRFTPDQSGRWDYVLNLRDRDGQAQPLEGSFVCTPSELPGFLRRDTGPFLRFDDGSVFFAIGQNMSWGNDSDPLRDYAIWLAGMASAGGNYIRPWMASWAFGIEWNDTGLGDYSQRLDRAYNLDGLFDLAQEHGVRLQLVLNNHGQLSSTTNPEWDRNPYNSANGGPCVQPRDFYTDPQAKALFKRRLRYIVARWGYAPDLLAWELFNEVDLTDDYSQHRSAVITWHAEMAAELKRLDPNSHLVTTSLSGTTDADAPLWSIDAIDLTQVHYYIPGGDQVGAQQALMNQFRRTFGKPTLIGEFCFTDAATARRLDPEGVYLHNALWASAFSGAYGGASIWWWDNYIEPLNLYHRFAGIAAFIAGVDLEGYTWTPTIPRTKSAVGDLSLAPGFGFGQAPADHFEVLPQGTSLPPSADLGGFLFGAIWNTDLRRPPVFAVDYSTAGRFEVLTADASGQDPTIEIWLDGSKVLDQPAQPATAYAVNIPAGRHQIRVDNQGTDWIRIERYTFSDYTPRLRAFALQTADRATGWVQNRDYNWQTLRQSGRPTALNTGRLFIDAIGRDGQYHITWYSTDNAQIQNETTASAKDGRLTIAVPPLTWDLAFKAQYSGPLITAVAQAAQPQHFALAQNYPNPFNSRTTIAYHLPREGNMVLEVFDVLGRRVSVINNGHQDAGEHHAAWNGRDGQGRPLSSGLYFYRLQTDDKTQTRKMALIR
jgi:hypothetical protein